MSDNLKKTPIEEALKNSESELGAIYENVPLAMLHVNHEWRVVKLNAQAASMAGRSKDEAIGLRNGEALRCVNATLDSKGCGFSPACNTCVIRSTIVKTFETGEAYHRVETCIQYDYPDGPQDMHILVSTNHIRLSGENLVLVCIEDITERRQTEAALRKSEAFQRTLLETSPDYIFVLDTNGTITRVNRVHPSHTKEDIVRKKVWTFIPPEYQDTFRTAFWRAANTGQIQTVETTVNLPDGQHYFLNRLNPIYLAGEKGSIVLTATDITERRQAEKALLKSEARFKELAEMLPEAVFESDIDLNVTYANQHAFELFGYTEADLARGINGLELLVPKDRDRAMQNFAKRLDNRIDGAIEYQAQRKDGSTFPMFFNVSPIMEGDHVIGFRGIIIDITDKQIMDRRLRQAEKMEAIGHLAGGIAHDFNNILGGIIGYGEMTLEKVQKGGRVEHNIIQILKAGNRATQLVGQILSFSRQTPETMAPLDLKPIVFEAVEFLRASLPATIDIRCALAEDTEPIMGNATNIHEIIVNLCTNARDAMEDKGILEISYSETQLVARMDGRIGSIEPGFYSVISVGDNGHGISQEALLHIFEPFYTTKEVGRGTGLGLAVVFGIVQQHGGEIVVESNPDIGTKFQLYLPKIAPNEIEDDKKDVIVSKGTERILFIDDEALLNDMAVEMLSSLGYRVSAFTDSVKALHAFEATPDSFDLVITDQAMPDLSGLELSKELIRIRDDIPIVLCTGYSKYVDEAISLAVGIKGYCMKPYRIRDIAHKVRYVLDEKGN